MTREICFIIMGIGIVLFIIGFVVFMSTYGKNKAYIIGSVLLVIGILLLLAGFISSYYTTISSTVSDGLDALDALKERKE